MIAFWLSVGHSRKVSRLYVSFSDKTGCYGGLEGRRRAAVETENRIKLNKADDAR